MKNTMKNIFITLITFLLISNSFAAEWQKAAKSAENNDTYYIDIQKIKQRDNYVDVTILSDYENEMKIQNYRFRSEIENVTFNCANQTYTRQDATYFELNKLAGKKVLYLKKPDLSKDEKIDNVGIGNMLYKFACDVVFRHEIINYYGIQNNLIINYEN